MKIHTRKESRKLFTGVSISPQELLKLLQEKGFEFMVDIKTPKDPTDGWYFDFSGDDVVWDGTNFVFFIDGEDQPEVL